MFCVTASDNQNSSQMRGVPQPTGPSVPLQSFGAALRAGADAAGQRRAGTPHVHAAGRHASHQSEARLTEHRLRDGRVGPEEQIAAARGGEQVHGELFPLSFVPISRNFHGKSRECEKATLEAKDKGMQREAVLKATAVRSPLQRQ